MVLGTELFVGSPVGLAQLITDVVLVADKDELPCRARITVAQEIVHPQPEVFQTEFGKSLRRRGVGIEVVFGQRPPLQPLALPVQTDHEACGQKKSRSDDVLRQSAEPIRANYGMFPKQCPTLSLGAVLPGLHRARAAL